MGSRYGVSMCALRRDTAEVGGRGRWCGAGEWKTLSRHRGAGVRAVHVPWEWRQRPPAAQVKVESHPSVRFQSAGWARMRAGGVLGAMTVMQRSSTQHRRAQHRVANAAGASPDQGPSMPGPPSTACKGSCPARGYPTSYGTSIITQKTHVRDSAHALWPVRAQTLGAKEGDPRTRFPAWANACSPMG